MRQIIIRIGIIFFICWLWTSQGLSEEIAQRSITDPVPAAEEDGTHLKPGGPTWNVYDAGPFTMQFGGGQLIDYATYYQDSESERQMELRPAWGARDFRFLVKGNFRDAPRLSYMLGYMYDGTVQDWRFRQTGIRIEVPEWDGNVFIGRTKEGFSTSKASTGYFGFFNERPTVSDAFLPIVADGVKWTGYKRGFAYNLGMYTNAFANYKESYYKNDQQAIARLVWLPFAESESKTLLRLAVEARHATPKAGEFQYRSKPESFTAQGWAVDTGVFPGKLSRMYGLETYYRPGAFTSGFEYFWNFVESEQMQNPLLHGGEIFAGYMLTGEVHPYDEQAGVFKMVVPKQSFFKDGTGAFEVLLRYSYSDFNSGLVDGGRFARITPMLNWYLNEVMRAEFVYGYSVLDRFNLQGHTQYFQARLQMDYW